MAGALLDAALQYTDEPWAYRLKRHLRSHLVSSEFDVGFRTNELGLRGPALVPCRPVVLSEDPGQLYVEVQVQKLRARSGLRFVACPAGSG
ncbi:MAG: hypothetical protein WDA75_20805 [Candidatus Latescibacterota bacterium]|jgi:hypothetical protein